jgi:hypothetical protein
VYVKRTLLDLQFSTKANIYRIEENGKYRGPEENSDSTRSTFPTDFSSSKLGREILTQADFIWCILGSFPVTFEAT